MVDQNFELLTQYDPEVGTAMKAELARQRRNLELIASENIVSDAVLAAMGSVLTNKYAEGYPGKRYYGGCECADVIEDIAIDRAKRLFNCEYANVQPHSGSQANMAVFFAVLEPGDTFLAMDFATGGHLTHGSPVNMSGKYYNCVSYGIDENGWIDYDNVREQALKHRPKLILAGSSAYSRIIDFKKFREIADEVGAVLMVDMAHISGLIAGGAHPNPFPYADVVTTTTHKTLRGPRGGMILATSEAAAKYNFNKAVFPGIQGGPLLHVIAGKAVAFAEALRPEFKTYAHQIVKNAQALSKGLTDRGLKIVSGGTDNHVMLLDMIGKEVTGKELQIKLDDVYITVNKNMVPGDPRSPFVTSGIRLGSAAVTSRGFNEAEMDVVADLIFRAVDDYDNNTDYIRNKVNELCSVHPIYCD